GVPADVEPVGVAAIARRVLVGPGDAASDLVSHHPEVAARRLDGDEIERDVDRAGADEQLRRVAKILRLAPEPGAAVDEHEDRRFRPPGAVDVELLDLGRTVGNAHRRAEPGARQLAVRRPSLSALVEEGGVVDLVVRGIQLDLIHVHPYAGAFLVGRGADPAFLGERRGRDGGGRGGEHRSPAEQGPIEYRLTRHVFPPRMSRVARSFGARAGPAWTKSALPSMHTVR